MKGILIERLNARTTGHCCKQQHSAGGGAEGRSARVTRWQDDKPPKSLGQLVCTSDALFLLQNQHEFANWRPRLCPSENI